MDNTSDRRRAFMRLTEKEKFETLFEMINFQAASRASDAKILADLRQDYEYMQGELDGINHRRGETLDTSQKIRAELSRQNPGWIYYKDRVLPGTLTAIQTVILLAILYLAFGGKIP
jgi:hypothetical protein